MSLKKAIEGQTRETGDDASRDDASVEAPTPSGDSGERIALQQALARRDECRARSRNYSGRSTHVRRKLDAALRAAESDVAILRYALGEGVESDDMDATDAGRKPAGGAGI